MKFAFNTGSWRPLPGHGGPDHIFAIGDLHGNSEVLAALLAKIKDIPRSGQPRSLVFLGDLIDRGRDSLGVIELVKAAETVADVDEVIRLAGNHELMLEEFLRFDVRLGQDWLNNGGYAMLDEIDPHVDSPSLRAVRKVILERRPWLVDFLAEGRSHWTSGDLVFVHAGLHPQIPMEEWLGEDRFAAVPTSRHWAWIREPFLSWTKPWHDDPRRVVVHGHTRVTSGFMAAEDLVEACDLVATHRRINLDAGCGVRYQGAILEMRGDQYRVHAASWASLPR